ncbi:DUF58 domain-containing protein [bacterium]|nr:DUF58 domain-containing protein [bacterium]
MELTSSKPRLTGLLSNETLARVERMRLVPNRRRTNRAQGEHLSGKGGTSIEFSDYRDYVAGDDIRRVDWNIFARLQRPYLKLYSHEEEMHVTVLVDASSSMRSEEKFDRARQLAAAFSVMGLMGGERVSVFACNHSGAGPEMETRMAGRVSTRRVFRFLENLEPGGDVPVEHAIESMLRLHHGRGIAIVLSDFLTFGDVSRSFNLLYSAGLELFALQLLGPSEIDPEITGDVRFVDSETGDALDISSAGELLGLYHEHRLGLEQFLGEQSRKRNGRFVSLSSGKSVERILFETLLRQGWVQ